MDQTAPDVKSESQEPQNQQHCKERPKHTRHILWDCGEWECCSCR